NHLAALRVRDCRRIEARQRHHHGIRIALDCNLVRLAHVDKKHAPLGQPARNVRWREILNPGITTLLIGHGRLLRHTQRTANQPRGGAGESSKTWRGWMPPAGPAALMDGSSQTPGPSLPAANELQTVTCVPTSTTRPVGIRK